MRNVPDLQIFLEGFKSKNRTILAQAITLIESQKTEHQELARELLKHLLPKTGSSRRIGISGTPGVGKSTFIEVFGKRLTAKGRKVAVLAVDPTSQVSGGSILGDKTRMQSLANDPLAFIRPSPSGLNLGGVARRTRESILLCEAFGFDDILVETVGVGQSETTVASMVDIFVMLLQPGSGDDLQGIKRGILEIVDMVIVTKDDGDNSLLIQRACHDYQKALEILRHDETPKVLACSAISGKGMNEIEISIESYFSQLEKIEAKRSHQSQAWMWQIIEEGLRENFFKTVSAQDRENMERMVLEKKISVPEAAAKLLRQLDK